jgi:hypothetical protein
MLYFCLHSTQNCSPYESSNYLVDSESSERSSFSDDLNIGTILSELTFFLESGVVFVGVLGETKLAGNDDLLSTGELELSSSESFNSVGNVLFDESNGVQDLVDLNSSNLSCGLAVSSSHTGLKSISTGAGKHFVNSDNVPRVDSASQMETFLTALLDQVLVGSNTASFHSFGGDLFLFEGDKVDRVGEFFDFSLLLTSIINSNSGIGDTSVITRLGERLASPISVASSGSSSH